MTDIGRHIFVVVVGVFVLIRGTPNHRTVIAHQPEEGETKECLKHWVRGTSHGIIGVFSAVTESDGEFCGFREFQINGFLINNRVLYTLPFSHQRERCHYSDRGFVNVHLYLKHKDIGLTPCYALNGNLRLDSRDILTLWQKFTKYSQSINSVSKLSVLAKHVLKYIAENFIDLTESVFKSNLTEFVADRLGMEGARDLLCWRGGSVKIIYFICWCSFNNDLWSKAFPFAASKTRISLSIMRGKTFI